MPSTSPSSPAEAPATSTTSSPPARPVPTPSSQPASSTSASSPSPKSSAPSPAPASPSAPEAPTAAHQPPRPVELPAAAGPPASTPGRWEPSRLVPARLVARRASGAQAWPPRGPTSWARWPSDRATLQGSAIVVARAFEVVGEATDAVEQLPYGTLREAVLPSRCPDGRQQPSPGPLPDGPRTDAEQLRHL